MSCNSAYFFVILLNRRNTKLFVLSTFIIRCANLKVDEESWRIHIRITKKIEVYKTYLMKARTISGCLKSKETFLDPYK